MTKLAVRETDIFKMACRGGCYYCCGEAHKKEKMDLDSALNELGMLSSVTNSRKEYIRERKRSTSESTVSQPFNEPLPRPFNEPVQFNNPTSNFQGKGFHILQVDPNYVTGFSSDLPVTMATSEASNSSNSEMDISKIPSTSETTPILDPRSKGCFCHSSAHKKIPRCSKFRKDRYRRYLKPYEVPWRLDNSLPKTDYLEHSVSKSNGSSPVKAVKDGPLTRSRSLTNLESARARLADIFEEPNPHHSCDRQEIDKVSQRIENLHFVEKT